MDKLTTGSLFGVQGKVVVVTGGGKGIGKMIAAGFVANGAHVFICSRKVENIKSTAEELTNAGPGTCHAHPADLATVEGCDGYAKLLREHGVSKIHVLVNNSGASWGEPLEKYQEKGWDKCMDLNVKGVFYLTKALLPELRAAGTLGDPARVINIGSVAGIRPQRVPTFAYDVSKAAVHALTQKLAFTLAPQHITVNAIAPGLVPSDMSKGLLKYTDMAEITRGIPLGRPGGAADMAGAALFLSSTASSWITGVILPVGGGVSISPSL